VKEDIGIMVHQVMDLVVVAVEEEEVDGQCGQQQ